MRKIAIVGGAPTSWHLAPFDDESWEIWVLGNQLSRYDGKSITRVFEIHEDLSEQKPEYPELLVKNAPRLTVSAAFPIKEHPEQMSTIEVYPKEDVIKVIGGHLSSSPAYMMGYAALLDDVEEIAIYGVDMAVADHEYFKQRPDMYAWIGYFMGKGITVTLPPETHLFSSTYDEGRDWNGGTKSGSGPFTQANFAEMATEHRDKARDLGVQIKEMEKDRYAHIGTAMAYEHMGKVARAVDSGADVKSIKEVSRVE